VAPVETAGEHSICVFLDTSPIPVLASADDLSECKSILGEGMTETDVRTRDERLARLKREIALNRYDMDSTAVAHAIRLKLRLLHRGRIAIAAAQAGRSREQASSFHTGR
jgi:hypothetical protein